MKKITLLLTLFLAFGYSGYAQVSAYGFSQSSETYSEITGGTVMGTATTATSFDSQLWPIANGSIPFNFNFNGVDYTGCSVNSNGYITFGTTTSSSFTSTAISSTTAYAGAVAAWSGDLNAAFITGVIAGETRWEVVGTAPNREFVIQFKNWRPAYSSSTTNVPFINFQFRLVETSNVVKIVYGSNGFAAGSTVASSTRQIGLRGATNADYNNRLNATTLAFTSSTAGTTNSSTQAFNTNVTTPGMPSDGLTYSWTPPSCLSPASLVATNITTTGVDISWTHPTMFDFEYVLQAPGTGVPTGLGDPIADTSISFNSLTPETAYEIYVRTDCGGGEFSSWSGPLNFFTGYCPVVSTASGSYVNNFTTTGGNTNISNLASGYATNGYQDATSMVVSQYAGAAVDFSTALVGTTVGVNVWIDWNNDLVFDNATERVYASGGYVSTAAGTITVPTGTALGNYRMRIRCDYNATNPNACGTSGSGRNETEDYTFTVIAPPACLPPTTLAASNITASTVDLSWVAGSVTQTDFEYVIQTAGTGVPTISGLPTAGVTVGTEAFDINGDALAANTLYEVYVRANCLTDGFSTWAGPITFRTACAVVTTFPYTEGFEADNPCWTNLQVSGTDNWLRDPAGGSGDIAGAHTGTGFMEKNFNTSEALLFSPQFDLTALGTDGRVKVWLHRHASADFDDQYIVYVNTTASLTGATQLLDLYSIITIAPTVSATGWYEYTLNIPSSFNTSNSVYIIFQGITTGGFSSYDLGVDDFTLEAVPSCFEPTTLSVTNITATSVDLSWVDPSGVQADFQYVIQLAGTGVPTGAGTQISATSVTGETLDFSGAPLTANTAYEYYVRAECTFSSFSTWAGPFPFRTLCSTFTAPFNEPFATAVLPSCWSQGGATPWEYGSATGTTPVGFAAYGASAVADHTAAGGTFIGMDGSDNDNAEVSTLTSPLIDVTPLTTPRLKYAVFSNNVDDAARNTLDVEVYDGAAWNTVNSITDNLGTGWVDFTTDLSTLTITGAIQIRFTITGVSNGGFTFYNDILIDDVIVEETPTCAEPTNLTVSNITSTTANLAWTATTGNYEYVLDMVATNPTGSGTAYASETYSASSLTPSTTYYFHVRTVCAGATYSTWSTVSFTTPATPPVNDNCATPTVLTPGGVFADNAVVGTTVNASTVTGLTYGCQTSRANDVWYSVVVPASGTITIETQVDGTSALTDTVLSVFSGTCGSLVEVGCDDDSGTDAFSILNLTQTPGSTLYIGVWRWSLATDGTFQVSAYDASLSANSFDSNSFVAYPNPVKDILNLEYNSEISSVRVMNLLGQEVISRNINANTTQVDMSQLSAGAYIVNVTIGDAVKTIKVVKQ